MRVDVLTLFPEVILGPLNESIVKRAREKGLLNVNVVNIRDFAQDKHRTVDDTPYGGGAGMVLKVDVLYRAVSSVLSDNCQIVLMTPGGRKYDQGVATELARVEHMIILCGHYEGYDERIREILNPLCLSIGDYILTNGALAAAVVIDSIARLLPGSLGNTQSVSEESYMLEGTLKYPQYTRPREFMGKVVPQVLLSGDHQQISRWRAEQAGKRTDEFKI